MRTKPDDEEALPVMVPRNNRALVEVSANRVQRLGRHLMSLLARMKADGAGSPPRPDLEGFAGRVASTACSLCRGWCCRNGADDGFIDEPTLARQSLTASGAEAVIQSYLDRVPAFGYEGSCIFHAEQGCTLDRSMRSDVCNAYFCGGLQAYVTSVDVMSPVVVIAGERALMRRSPVLMP
jgi:hypothetical protein